MRCFISSVALLVNVMASILLCSLFSLVLSLYSDCLLSFGLYPNSILINSYTRLYVLPLPAEALLMISIFVLFYVAGGHYFVSQVIVVSQVLKFVG